MEKSADYRIAVVTGGNKGIGLEICRQLSEKGIEVVLTARDEERGKAAVKKLLDAGAKDLVFHQLDVADSASIASLKDFIETQFGRLDILVNNAGVGGVGVEPQALTSNQAPSLDTLMSGVVENYEMSKECIDINYYGLKTMCESFIPLLQLSPSPRIVNLTSAYGKLQIIPGEDIKKELRNIDDLTEEKLDGIVGSFLNDFKAETYKEKGWPTAVSAYKVSKVAVSAYTRILAKKYPKICINCVHPGFAKTDINYNTGILSVEEGAKGPVMAALLPEGSSSGQFYDKTELSSFE